MGSIPDDQGEDLFSLRSTEQRGRPQFRAFAELMLDHLSGVGLPEMDLLRRAPEGNTDAPDPKADAGAYDPDLRRFRLDNGQTAYVYLNAERSRHGYKELAVLSREQAEQTFVGSRAERAITVATTLMGYTPIDVKTLGKALERVEGTITKSAEEHRRETAEKILKRDKRGSMSLQQRRETAQQALEFQHNLQTPSLEYALALLRYHRPSFHALQRHEQLGLILLTCEYLNDVLESARKLAAFLEYGTEVGLLKKTVSNLNRDVRAAVLSEVTGLSHREIGQELHIPVPPDSRTKGGNDTVRKSIQQGLAFLKKFFGEEGWRERRVTMKAEAERYKTLSEEERSVEDLAERWGVSKEEARECYEHNKQRYGDVPLGLPEISEEELLDHLRTLDQEGH